MVNMCIFVECMCVCKIRLKKCHWLYKFGQNSIGGHFYGTLCRTVIPLQKICTEFNNYFSTIWNVLLEELNKSHPNVTDTAFTVFCGKPTKTSIIMFVTPVGPEELQRLVNSLTNNFLERIILDLDWLN